MPGRIAAEMLFVTKTIETLTQEFDLIPEERKNILSGITAFIESRISEHSKADLIFICTHNSRRSHIAQIWSQAAAAWYNVTGVNSYSGGTEATAFNVNAIEAMGKLGFRISRGSDGKNPRYIVTYADNHHSFEVFSKKYDESPNPRTGFAAIMTCTQADADCPIVSGSAIRISLPYDDPKNFDRTELESAKYTERALEIGRELLFVFSQIKKR